MKHSSVERNPADQTTIAVSSAYVQPTGGEYVGFDQMFLHRDTSVAVMAGREAASSGAGEDRHANRKKKVRMRN